MAQFPSNKENEMKLDFVKIENTLYLMCLWSIIHLSFLVVAYRCRSSLYLIGFWRRTLSTNCTTKCWCIFKQYFDYYYAYEWIFKNENKYQMLYFKLVHIKIHQMSSDTHMYDGERVSHWLQNTCISSTSTLYWKAWRIKKGNIWHLYDAKTTIWCVFQHMETNGLTLRRYYLKMGKWFWYTLNY